MSYTSEETSVDIELEAYAPAVRVETDSGTERVVEIVELLRVAGVDRRAFCAGSRMHITISYSYPS